MRRMGIKLYTLRLLGGAERAIVDMVWVVTGAHVAFMHDQMGNVRPHERQAAGANDWSRSVFESFS